MYTPSAVFSARFYRLVERCSNWDLTICTGKIIIHVFSFVINRTIETIMFFKDNFPLMQDQTVAIIALVLQITQCFAASISESLLLLLTHCLHSHWAWEEGFLKA